MTKDEKIEVAHLSGNVFRDVKFLVYQRIHFGLTILKTLIFLYFITVISLSKRWDVLLPRILRIDRCCHF